MRFAGAPYHEALSVAVTYNADVNETELGLYFHRVDIAVLTNNFVSFILSLSLIPTQQASLLLLAASSN